MRIKSLLSIVLFLSFGILYAGNDHGDDDHGDNHSHEQGDHSHDHGDAHADHGACHIPHHEDVFNPGAVAFHHISDQNIFSIGPWHIPLPVISWVPGQGFDVFSSGKFKADYHGNARHAYDGYVLYEGSIKRIQDASFPKGSVELAHHSVYAREMEIDGKAKDVIHVCHDGKEWVCDNKSTLDFGLFGGGLTSFHDLSLTKNVVSMILMFLLAFFVFRAVTKKYKEREGEAPSGLQGFIEPIFMFIQDEVCKPFLGHKWEKYQSFIMSLFFFILFLNLFGQVPFFGGSNVTGNLSVTFVLAVFAFLVTNLSGNKHYWEHIFWMPGIPAWVKTIVTPVEFLGVFIKPLTLMLRLFGNITAGHMVIVIFVGLIFIFGENGANPGAALGTAVGSTLLTIFMMAIELLVAFIQAFVFAILTASYIGAATEEAHH